MEPTSPQNQIERNNAINKAVEKIATDLKTKSKWRDAEQNPEWLALAVLNMIEWQVDQVDRKIVAKRLLNVLGDFLPLEAKGIIRKYFDIFN